MSNELDTRICLRGEHVAPVSAFRIATRVCDKCVAEREWLRRTSLGTHPDLEGRDAIATDALRFIPSIKVGRQIVRYWLLDFGLTDSESLRPNFRYDPETVSYIRIGRQTLRQTMRSLRKAA